MNRYKVTKQLGDGTYGSVLKAVNRSTHEVVAIKKMKKSIENGGVDALIIIKKFISHSVTEPLKAALKENPQCKSAMAKGYGKAQLKLALELLADQL